MESALACLALVLPVVVVVPLWVWLRQRSAAAVADVDALLGRDAVLLRDTRARSFGLGSAGWKGIRGTGCLALSADTLVFRYWVPTLVVLVPRTRITAVDRVRSHNGKSVVAPLVRVTFTGEDGRSDTLAWQVRDTDRWVAALAPSVVV